MNAVLRIFVWLLALSLVALPVVAVLNGWVAAERWPLAKLRVHGEFKRVPAEKLQQVILPYAQAGFFAVKLQDAQDAIEQLPWVESAQVRKQWPDVLEITLVEHKPFAHWGKDRLLSEQGRLFATPKQLEDVHCHTWKAPTRRPRRWWRSTTNRAPCSRLPGWMSPGSAWTRAAAGRCS